MSGWKITEKASEVMGFWVNQTGFLLKAAKVVTHHLWDEEPNQISRVIRQQGRGILA